MLRSPAEERERANQLDPFVEVNYLMSLGGSGSTRMRLSRLPDWLSEPGDRGNALVFAIRRV